MHKRYEFHFLGSQNTFNNVVIVIIVIVRKVSQLFVYCLETLVSKLVFKIDSQSFYSIAH